MVFAICLLETIRMILDVFGHLDTMLQMDRFKNPSLTVSPALALGDLLKQSTFILDVGPDLKSQREHQHTVPSLYDLSENTIDASLKPKKSRLLYFH